MRPMARVKWLPRMICRFWKRVRCIMSSALLFLFFFFSCLPRAGFVSCVLIIPIWRLELQLTLSSGYLLKYIIMNFN